MSQNIYKKIIDDVIKRNFTFPEQHPEDYWDYDQPYDGEIDTKNLHLLRISEHTNFLNNLFDHLTASAKNIEQFKNYYCFIKESVNLSKREISAVNYDENTALECLESLIGYANNGTTAHFLTGKKGAGKTFFINYLLTVHRSLLLDKKIIYVRTSLLKRIEDELISNRVERQSIKILVEHYFTKNIFSFEKFEGFLRKSIPEQLTDGDFCPEIREFFLNKNFIEAPRWLFKYLHEYVRSLGYSFFFIIDGLDAVEPTTEEEERFKGWFNEVMEFANGELPYVGAWLFVTRDFSFERELPSKQSLSSIRAIGQFKSRVFVLKPACLFVALMKRSDYESKAIKSKYGIPISNVIANIPYIVAKMITKAFSQDPLHLYKQENDGFIPKHKAHDVSIDSVIYERLIDIFDGDLRKAMLSCHTILLASALIISSYETRNLETLKADDVINSIIGLDGLFMIGRQDSTFEEDVISSQLYRLVHPFVCGFNLYCVNPFQYELNGGNVVKKVSYGYDIESGTLPNLFSMDMNVIYEKSSQDSESLIMAKFCKVVLLVYFYRFSYNKNGVNYRKANQLIEKLFDAFFDKSIIEMTWST